MDKLIIATNNKHKLDELRQILTPYFNSILSLSEAGIRHETVEDADTFEGNALKKAREIAIFQDAPRWPTTAGWLWRR